MQQKVLVFGADGQLGHDLVEVFSSTHAVVACTRNDVDITQEQSVLHAITSHRPTLVINCAAFTKVDENEAKAAESFQVNAVGALYVSRAAASLGTPVIVISTDYVFDGSKKSFSETDPPHPLNVYGVSKYAGELLTAIGNPRAYIIRTSALFGSHASGKGYNFVTKMIELAAKSDPIRVVNDQYTCPTYTRDLASKIHELVTRAVPPGIYHVTNQSSCSWYEFALEILRQSGTQAKVISTLARDYPSALSRPYRSVLENRALRGQNISLLPSWQDGLKRYLQEIHQFHAN